MARLARDMRTGQYVSLPDDYDDVHLTTRELARVANVTPYTARQWVASGKVRGVKPGGQSGHWRIPRAEVERLMGGGA